MCHLILPELVSTPFFGLMGVVLDSVVSFSLPFRLIGLRDGVLVRDGNVAWFKKKKKKGSKALFHTGIYNMTKYNHKYKYEIYTKHFLLIKLLHCSAQDHFNIVLPSQQGLGKCPPAHVHRY